MNKQKLYKMSFSNSSGVFVNVVVSVKKEYSNEKALDLIAKEVASNYCEDNHFPYNEDIIMDLKNSSTVKYFGILEPDETSEDSEYLDSEFNIILFNKTKYWSEKD